MTALENTLVGMHSRLKSGILGSVLHTPKVKREEREARKRARELLEFSGLKGRAQEFARNLSYGDQRRLEVARALADPAGADPPGRADGGDEPAGDRGLHRLRSPAPYRGRADRPAHRARHARVVMGVSDRVTVLDYGEKIAEGSPQEVQKDPKVIEALPRQRGREGAA